MLYQYKIKDNPQLYISCGVMLAVFACIAAILPLATALGMTALSWQQWLITIGLALIPTVVAEYGKLWDAVKSRNAERTMVKDKNSRSIRYEGVLYVLGKIRKKVRA